MEITATTAAIAAEVGCSSAFTFRPAFTRAYGTSPTAYRRTRGLSQHPPGNRAAATP